MKQSEGFNDGTERVCRLKKSLYGLKQAPRCWNATFVKSLLDLGLRQCESDPCVFTGAGASTLILGIYVDDGLLAGEDEREMRAIIAKLKSLFQMSECEVGLFIGQEITRKENGDIILSQESYCGRVLERFHMGEAHPKGTPTTNSLSFVKSPESAPSFPYREAVGSLLYLAVWSRPDLAFAVGVSSRHLENPTEEDVLRVKRIFRYLVGTKGFALRFPARGGEELIGYCDSDFAGDTEERKSTSGYIFLVGGAAVSWRSERQSVVATSTTEAEYIAAAEAVKELVSLRRLLQELGRAIEILKLKMDNQTAQKLIENPIVHRRTKHIDVRYRFVRDEWAKNAFEVEHVGTEEQAADFLTKGLTQVKLKGNLDRINAFVNK